MNYAQLIADAAAPGTPTAEYAGEIVHETERVATIVRNLLQFARQEKQAHSPARLQDIVEQTLSLLRAVLRRDQITLTVDVPDGLPALKCRSQQLQQVLMNLLTNARDALNAKYPGYHADKTICISVRRFEQERPFVAPPHRGRPGPRHPGGDPGPDLRPLLHHQAPGPGDRPGPIHQPRDRAGPPRRGSTSRPSQVSARGFTWSCRWTTRGGWRGNNAFAICSWGLGIRTCSSNRKLPIENRKWSAGHRRDSGMRMNVLPWGSR